MIKRKECWWNYSFLPQASGCTDGDGSFLLVVIMVYSIGVWAHVEQEKQQIDVELSHLIAEREYYETIKRDLPNMKRNISSLRVN